MLESTNAYRWFYNVYKSLNVTVLCKLVGTALSLPAVYIIVIDKMMVFTQLQLLGRDEAVPILLCHS